MATCEPLPILGEYFGGRCSDGVCVCNAGFSNVGDFSSTGQACPISDVVIVGSYILAGLFAIFSLYSNALRAFHNCRMRSNQVVPANLDSSAASAKPARHSKRAKRRAERQKKKAWRHRVKEQNWFKHVAAAFSPERPLFWHRWSYVLQAVLTIVLAALNVAAYARHQAFPGYGVNFIASALHLIVNASAIIGGASYSWRMMSVPLKQMALEIDTKSMEKALRVVLMATSALSIASCTFPMIAAALPTRSLGDIATTFWLSSLAIFQVIDYITMMM